MAIVSECNPLPLDEESALFADPPLGTPEAMGKPLMPPPFIFGNVGGSDAAYSCTGLSQSQSQASVREGEGDDPSSPDAEQRGGGDSSSSAPPRPVDALTKSVVRACREATRLGNSGDAPLCGGGSRGVDDPFALGEPLMLDVKRAVSTCVRGYVPMYKAVESPHLVVNGRVEFAEWLAEMKRHVQTPSKQLRYVEEELERLKRAPPHRRNHKRVTELEELLARSRKTTTIVCMNSGSFVMTKPEDERVFLRLYAGALSVGANMWVVERTSQVVRMFMDLDFQQLGAIAPHVMIAVASIVQRVMRRVFARRPDVAHLMSVALETGAGAPSVDATPPPRVADPPTTEAEGMARIDGMQLAEYLRCIVCTCDYQEKGIVSPTIVSNAAAAARRERECGSSGGDGGGGGGGACDVPPPAAARYIKSGCHLIWPNVYIDGNTAADIRANVVLELMRVFGMRRPELGQNSWYEVVDHRVYGDMIAGREGCGMRMLGSRKVDKCPKCDGGQLKLPRAVVCGGGGAGDEEDVTAAATTTGHAAKPPSSGTKRRGGGGSEARAEEYGGLPPLPRTQPLPARTRIVSPYACHTCLDKYRVDVGRPYMPLCVLDGWGRRDLAAEAAYRANLYLLVLDSKVRTPFTRTLPNSGYQLTPECITADTLPPDPTTHADEVQTLASALSAAAAAAKRRAAHSVDAATSGSGGGGGGGASGGVGRSSTGGPKIPLRASDARWRVIEALIRTAFNGRYANVEITNISTDARGTDYMVNVMGVQYCHNAGRAHTRNRVYFKITSVGLEQRCYSDSVAPAKGVSCRKYSTAPQALLEPVRAALFTVPHEVAREAETRATLVKSGALGGHGAMAAAAMMRKRSGVSGGGRAGGACNPAQGIAKTGALLASMAAAADDALLSAYTDVHASGSETKQDATLATAAAAAAATRLEKTSRGQGAAAAAAAAAASPTHRGDGDDCARGGSLDDADLLAAATAAEVAALASANEMNESCVHALQTAGGSVHSLRAGGGSMLAAVSVTRLAAACDVALETLRAMSRCASGGGDGSGQVPSAALSQLIRRMGGGGGGSSAASRSSSTSSLPSGASMLAHTAAAAFDGGGGSVSSVSMGDSMSSSSAGLTHLMGDARIQGLLHAADSLSRSAFGVEYSRTLLKPSGGEGGGGGGSDCAASQLASLPEYMRVDPRAVGPRELDALAAVGLLPPPSSPSPQTSFPSSPGGVLFPTSSTTSPATSASRDAGAAAAPDTRRKAAAPRRAPWYEDMLRLSVTPRVSQGDRTQLLFAYLGCAVDAATTLPPTRVAPAFDAAAAAVHAATSSVADAKTSTYVPRLCTFLEEAARVHVHGGR